MDCTYDGPFEGLPWLAHMGQCEPHRLQGWDEHVVPRIYVGTVPGGHNETHDAQYRYQSQFDKRIDEYRKAKADGVQPVNSTLKGIKKGYERVKSQQRAITKLKKQGDVSNLKVAPGVEK